MLLDGKKVYVGPFLRRQDRPDDGEVRYTNVYVKNLADSVTDEKLNEMFAEFGPVTSAIVMKVSQSVGFHSFQSMLDSVFASCKPACELSWPFVHKSALSPVQRHMMS